MFNFINGNNSNNPDRSGQGDKVPESINFNDLKEFLNKKKSDNLSPQFPTCSFDPEGMEDLAFALIQLINASDTGCSLMHRLVAIKRLYQTVLLELDMQCMHIIQEEGTFKKTGITSQRDKELTLSRLASDLGVLSASYLTFSASLEKWYMIAKPSTIGSFKKDVSNDFLDSIGLTREEAENFYSDIGMNINQ